MDEWHLTDLLAAMLAPPIVFLAGYNYRNIQAAGKHIHDLLLWKNALLPQLLNDAYVRRDALEATNKKLDEVGADVKELRALLIDRVLKGRAGA